MTTTAAETFANEEIKNKYQNSPYRIPLRNRAFALVDEQDFERVNAHKWHLSKTGYAQSSLDGKCPKMHHFVFRKPEKGYVIDHIDEDKLNNKLTNLRQASYSENSQNRSTRKKTKSCQYKGVSYRKDRCKYFCLMDGKTIYYGDDPQEAARMYDIYTFQKYGQYANNNHFVSYEDAMKYKIEEKEVPERPLPSCINIVKIKGRDYFRVSKEFNTKTYQSTFNTLEKAIDKLHQINHRIKLLQVMDELMHYFSPIQRNNYGIAVIFAYGGEEILVSDEDWHRLSKINWYINTNGYATTSKTKSMHRIICPCNDQTNVVHHVNGVRTDNRRENLALVSRTINAHQKKKTPSTSSQYFGVSYSTRDKKWRVQISQGYDRRYYGSFNTEEEAAMAYDSKCIEIYGAYANLNFAKDKRVLGNENF